MCWKRSAPRRPTRCASIRSPGHRAAIGVSRLPSGATRAGVVGNGSTRCWPRIAALLEHEAPLLFPDITYSFYPVYCRLFNIAFEAVPLDEPCESKSPTIIVRPARSSCKSKRTHRGGTSRAQMATLLEEHPDAPVVIDEAYVDFGAETANPPRRQPPEPIGGSDHVQVPGPGRAACRLCDRRYQP